MPPEWVGIVGFAALILLMMLRVPIALSMIAVGTVGYAYLVRPAAAMAKLGLSIFESVNTYELSVIPMFLLMGALLSSTGLGGDLYQLVDWVLGRVRGGLAMATIGASALFGAVCGSAIATASTISMVAIPEMRKYRYSPALAAGVSAVGATLGILIPPSTVLVLYGIITMEPIGPLLIAGIVPGVLTALALMAVVYVMVRLRPELAPIAAGNPGGRSRGVLARTWPVPAIFAVTIGGIYAGVFTPTEAGAIGALLSLAFSLATRRLSWQGFLASISHMARSTAMIFMIVVGGRAFSAFLPLTGLTDNLADLLVGHGLSRYVVVAFVFLVYFVLDAFVDELGVIVLLTPILYPVFLKLGFDGIWLGVFTVLQAMVGLLAPPVGLVSFVVAGLSGIPAGVVLRGVTPLWLTLVGMVILITAFPGIVTFLPHLMSRG